MEKGNKKRYWTSNPPNPENIWKHIVVPKDPNACWEWTGFRHDDGYGIMGFNNQNYMAHRFVYEYLVGEIPDGLTINHDCRNRACMNPKHLSPMTFEENISLGDFSTNNHNKKKTHCPKGHNYSKENLYFRPDGRRECLICKRESNRNCYHKKKAILLPR